MSQGHGDPSIPPASQAKHDEAEAAGRERYLDPATGFWVFTAAFLRARGHCCGSDCRHCPYPAAAQREAGRGTIRDRDPPEVPE